MLQSARHGRYPNVLRACLQKNARALGCGRSRSENIVQEQNVSTVYLIWMRYAKRAANVFARLRPRPS